MGFRLPDNVIRTRCGRGTLFRVWMTFTRPYHGLTGKEMDAAAAFLSHRQALLDAAGGDEALADRFLMSEAEKAAIRSELGMSMSYFQVVMSKLRRSGFIAGGKVNRRFVPNLTRGDGRLVLQVMLVYGDDEA